jgi:NAD(P)-dependent dehydrogenase (short-subunit alcohol dehydrogenase family)
MRVAVGENEGSDMAGRLNGKVALITGGTSGIGEATVELFVAEGAKVVIVGRNAEKGEAQAKALGPNTRFFRADVMAESEIAASVKAATDAFGRLDILFNNAGGNTAGGPTDFTEANFDHAMKLLLSSTLYGIKHAAPVMMKNGWGAIINNSSVAALRTHMGGYLYSIAKAGVTQATKMAGMELGRHGVTVNCISPGGIATPIFFGGSARADGMDDERRAATMAKLERNLAKATPIQKTGVPMDIAYAALFLASDEGHYVNCHDLVVDAGMTVGGRTNYEVASS